MRRVSLHSATVKYPVKVPSLYLKFYEQYEIMVTETSKYNFRHQSTAQDMHLHFEILTYCPEILLYTETAA